MIGDDLQVSKPIRLRTGRHRSEVFRLVRRRKLIEAIVYGDDADEVKRRANEIVKALQIEDCIQDIGRVT